MLSIIYPCFQGIHNSLSSFLAKLGYSQIKIDHFADSLLKLQIKIGVHLINVELTQLLTLVLSFISKFQNHKDDFAHFCGLLRKAEL